MQRKKLVYTQKTVGSIPNTNKQTQQTNKTTGRRKEKEMGGGRRGRGGKEKEKIRGFQEGLSYLI